MKTATVATIALLLISGTVSSAATIQDKDWHLSFHLSSTDQTNGIDELIEGFQNNSPVSTGTSAEVGIRAFASLSKSINHSLAVGMRAGVFTEGKANYTLVNGGSGTEILGILEARLPLGKAFGLRGTAGIGYVHFSKGLLIVSTDDGDLLGTSFESGTATASTFAGLVEPALEVRLSSVVTLEVSGSYRIIPTQEAEVTVSNIDQDHQEKFDLLSSGFSMGGGIGFHF